MSDFSAKWRGRVVASVFLIAIVAEGGPALAVAPAYMECEQGAVVSARLEGCDTAPCKDPSWAISLMALGDIRVGGYLSAQAIPKSLARVGKLGTFLTVELECASGQGGVDVVLRVVPRKRLADLKIGGNTHLYDSQIKDRIALASGDGMDPREKATDERLEGIRDTITRIYREDGFTGTVVTTKLVERDGNLVDLFIDIEEGDRVKIRDVVFNIRPARDVSPVENPHKVEGCPVMRQRDLEKWAGVDTGDAMTERTLPGAQRNLTRALRTIGFSGLRTSTKFDQSRRRLEMDVTYESCWLVRAFARDHDAPGRQGFVPVEEDDLFAQLPFGDSGVYDQTEADLGREEVRRYYDNRGFLFADVVLDYRARTGPAPTSTAWTGKGFGGDWDDRYGPGVAGVISYFVTTNRVAQIRKIEIEGNSVLSDAEIRTIMDTKVYDFFGSAGAVLPDQVFFDLDKIKRLYRDRGFFEMGFAWTSDGGNRRRTMDYEDDGLFYTYADPERAFKVRSTTDTEGVVLGIRVEEGRQSRIGAVDIIGGNFFPSKEIMRAVELEKNDPFSVANVSSAVARARRLYSNEGFLTTKIGVACVGHQPEVASDDCDLETVMSETVDLRIEVEEGRRTYVGQVFVEGARLTKDSVILKELPRPGEPYNVEKVAQGVRQLNNLGVFASIRVDALGADEKPARDRVGLVAHCREDESKFLDFAIGFEKLDATRSSDLPNEATTALSTTVSVTDLSTTGFGRALGIELPDILLTMEGRYTDKNFLGLAKRLYLPVKYGLSATAWDRYASFTPTFVDPYFFAKGLAFRVTPFAVYDRATTKLDQVQFGTEFALSKELAPRLYGALVYETAGVKTRDFETTTAYSPWRYENKVMPSIIYDRLDHPLNPKNGGFLQTSMAYINALDYGNFIKYEVLGKGFLTIRNFLTFAVTARFGGSNSFGGNDDLPDEERYTLGGNRGMRGFSTDGVAQYNADKSLRLVARETALLDPLGNPVTDLEGNVLTQQTYTKPYGGDVVVSGSFEMRFPIVRSIDLFGAVFYDVGALAETVGDLNPGSVRQSVGVGIRYMLADTIPFRLDYGIILERRCQDIDAGTGLCVRQEEIGNFHFGILYTF